MCSSGNVFGQLLCRARLKLTLGRIWTACIPVTGRLRCVVGRHVDLVVGVYMVRVIAVVACSHDTVVSVIPSLVLTCTPLLGRDLAVRCGCLWMLVLYRFGFTVLTDGREIGLDWRLFRGIFEGRPGEVCNQVSTKTFAVGQEIEQIKK